MRLHATQIAYFRYLFILSYRAWVGRGCNAVSKSYGANECLFKIKKLKNRKRKNKIFKNSKYVIRYDQYSYISVILLSVTNMIIPLSCFASPQEY